MNIYTTQALAAAVRALDVPAQFLLNLCFPAITEHEQEEILFDTDDSKPRMTPFVAPESKGQVVQSKGHKTSMFKPAYIKDKRILKPKTALRRAAGERIAGNLSPQERQAINLRNNLADQIEMKQRRMEWMAAQVLLDGAVTVSGENYPTTNVNFGRAAGLTKTLTGGARWGEAGVSPVDDLEVWIDEIHDTSGASPTHIVFDTKAMNYLKADPKFKDAVDTRRGGNSTAELGVTVRGQGNEKARRIGSLGDVELWKYQEVYTDDDGNDQKLIPDNTVLILAPSQLLGEQAYGAILDDDSLQATEMFVKSWVDEDPSVRYVLLQSGPADCAVPPERVVPRDGAVIAMKITSTTTLVTGSDEGPVDHKPGTPVDLPKAEAADLIERGIASRYVQPKPEAEPAKAPDGPINLNEADAETLVKIKGVGKATAGDIIASREADGPFESLEAAAERVGGVSVDQLQAAGVTL